MKTSMRNNERIMIAVIVTIGSIATFVGVSVTFASQPAVLQEEHSSAMTSSNVDTSVEPSHYVGGVTVPEQSVTRHPAPPEPFSIAINGSTEITTIAVKRGETAQIDVLISPKISGIIGNTYVQSVRPECGTSYSDLECTPVGITSSLSESIVSAPKHMVLTISVSSDMPVGLYAYEVISGTVLDVPYQNTPVHVSNIATFGIQVT